MGGRFELTSRLLAHFSVNQNSLLSHWLARGGSGRFALRRLWGSSPEPSPDPNSGSRSQSRIPIPIPIPDPEAMERLRGLRALLKRWEAEFLRERRRKPSQVLLGGGSGGNPGGLPEGDPWNGRGWFREGSGEEALGWFWGGRGGLCDGFGGSLGWSRGSGGGSLWRFRGTGRGLGEAWGGGLWDGRRCLGVSPIDLPPVVPPIYTPHGDPGNKNTRDFWAESRQRRHGATPCRDRRQRPRRGKCDPEVAAWGTGMRGHLLRRVRR